MKSITTLLIALICIYANAQQIDIKDTRKLYLKDADSTVGTYSINDPNAIEKLINYFYKYPDSKAEIVTDGTVKINWITKPDAPIRDTVYVDKPIIVPCPDPEPEPQPEPQPTAQPAAPVLISADRVGNNYILIIKQPDGTLIPDGGYDTFINNEDQNENTPNTTRTLTGLDVYEKQCFKVEARYTQLIEPLFLDSNERCVDGLERPAPEPEPIPEPTPTPTPVPTPTPNPVPTELKAFPSAYGAGANVTGGRGGSVYHVTTLNDGGNGSFRDAVSGSNRIIVFDVSGIIKLNSLLFVSSRNLTIAGQTAPEGGITLTGQRVYMEGADNIICRYIRFKGGISASNDSFSAVHNITNQIFDHCTFAFGGDEAASWYATDSGDKVDNLTVQRCLFAESLKGSIIGGESGTGADADDISILNNLFYNTSYRFPNIAGDGSYIDVINNVAWNAANRLIRANGSFNLNHIGNYYNYGSNAVENRYLNLFAYGRTPSIFTVNNKIVASNVKSGLSNSVSQMNSDNKLSWKFFLDGGGHSYGDQLPSSYFTSSQFALRGMAFSTLTGDEALINVRNNVGCNARLNADGSVSDNTDSLDKGWLDNVKSNRFTSKMSTGSYNVPNIPSVSRPSNYDSDNDGMPDVWETATFGNLGKTANGDEDNDGYTNIEEFLNEVDN